MIQMMNNNYHNLQMIQIKNYKNQYVKKKKLSKKLINKYNKVSKEKKIYKNI